MNIRELLENVKNNTIDIDGALDKLKNKREINVDCLID